MKQSSLSSGGIRACPNTHEQHPYTINIGGIDYHIKYDPGDSTSDFFGGNSNWRGPCGYLSIIYYTVYPPFGKFYGETLLVEYPVGSGKQLNLEQVADELTRRVSAFLV